MPLYTYQCTNTECPQHQEPPQELLVDIAERDDQQCSSCGLDLKRPPQGLRNKHVSWELWRV